MKIKIFSFISIAIVVSIILTVSTCSNHNEKCDSITKEKKEHLKNDTADVKINLKAYIENSGSMDGYVNGMTSFKTDIYSLISSSAISQLSLFYINDSVLEQPKDPKSFILNLTPTSFKERGGNRSSTDIAEVIKKVINSLEEKDVALLASDFIFSLGHGNGDVQRFLDMQKIDIINIFESKFKTDKTFSVVFLRNFSEFNGTYYDPQDNPFIINHKRPFYVMLAGNRNAISKLLNATRNVANFSDEYAEFSPMYIPYEVLKKPLSGKYQVGNKNKCGQYPSHLSKCEPERRSNKFEFQIAMNFSKLPLSFNFLEDSTNYSVSDKNFKIVKIKRENTEIGGHRYTHIMTISKKERTELQNTNLVIKVKKTQPDWIGESNDTSFQGTPDEKKTFGLFPMLDGIKIAYEKQTKSDYYTKFDIIIDKK